MAVGEYNGSIYLIGGWKYQKQVMTYDTQSNTWSDKGENALSTALSGGQGQYWTQQDSIVYAIIGASSSFDPYPLISTLGIYNMDTQLFTPNWKGIQLHLCVGRSGCVASTPLHLYIVGGFDGRSKMISNLQILSLTTHQWLISPQPPSMNERRGRHACIVKNDYLWAFGGKLQSVDVTHQTNERILIINIEQNAWQYIASLTTPLYGLRAVSWKDYIYIIGGETIHDPAQNIVHIINASSANDIVSMTNVMPYAVHITSPIVVDSVLYAFGGDTNSHSIDKWMYYILPSLSPSLHPTRHPQSQSSSEQPSIVHTHSDVTNVYTVYNNTETIIGADVALSFDHKIALILILIIVAVTVVSALLVFGGIRLLRVVKRGVNNSKKNSEIIMCSNDSIADPKIREQVICDCDSKVVDDAIELPEGVTLGGHEYDEYRNENIADDEFVVEDDNASLNDTLIHTAGLSQ
eukprot:71421_1